MKTFIGILFIGLLGFSGCSSSDAESNPAYNVQAIGMINGSELSVSAYVMDQEEKLSSDAMITINGEPMNIGFFSAEDLNIDGEDSLTDNNPTVQGVPSGDFQPFYFLDSSDLNEVDTVNFVARGRNGTTLLTSSNVVPEKLTLIEPSADATFFTGQEVYIKWEGGDPNTCFEVSYVGGSEAVSYSTGWIEDMYEYTITAGIIDSGPLFISVYARMCSDINDDEVKPTESGRAVLELYAGGVWTVDQNLVAGAGPRQVESTLTQCNRRASSAYSACVKECRQQNEGKHSKEVDICRQTRCLPTAVKRLKECKEKYCTLTCP